MDRGGFMHSGRHFDWLDPLNKKALVTAPFLFLCQGFRPLTRLMIKLMIAKARKTNSKIRPISTDNPATPLAPKM